MDDDPVPADLVKEMEGVDLRELLEGLEAMPQRTGDRLSTELTPRAGG
jgi:hypothetical protein